MPVGVTNEWPPNRSTSPIFVAVTVGESLEGGTEYVLVTNCHDTAEKFDVREWLHDLPTHGLASCSLPAGTITVHTIKMREKCII